MTQRTRIWGLVLFVYITSVIGFAGLLDSVPAGMVVALPWTIGATALLVHYFFDNRKD